MSLQTPPVSQQLETDDGLSKNRADTVDDLSIDDIFDILGNRKRRYVISYLLDNGERATVKELTEHIAESEFGLPSEKVTSNQHKSLYTALCQCHLPRLDEFDVIRYDEDEKTVTCDKAAYTVESFLHRGGRSTKVRMELAVALTIATLVTLGVFGVNPFGSISVVSWALLTVLTLFGFGLSQLFAVRRSS